MSLVHECSRGSFRGMPVALQPWRALVAAPRSTGSGRQPEESQ